MTDLDTPAGEALVGRRRAGGRAAHERSRLPQQRPFRQPRMAYEPTRAISDDELEAIHRASLRLLTETGMDFLDPDAREHLKRAGADVEESGQRVRFDPEMVEEVIKTVPAEFTLHARNPERHLRLGGDWMAFGTVGSPPNVADLDRGRRIGNREDYQNLLRLGSTMSPDLLRSLGDIQARLRTGEGIALQLRATEAAYERLFPKQVSAALSTDDVLRSAKSRWEEQYAALRRAALLQGQIADGIDTDTRLLGDAMARSRGAAGALEVAQAGNELTALSVKQSLALQGLLAAQHRAETIAKARELAAEDEARQRFKTFLGNGRAYTASK